VDIILKIIYFLYRTLILLQINIKPPQFLFNIPKEHDNHAIIEIIHADINFTPKERLLIAQALQILTEFTNNNIIFYVHYDLGEFDMNIEENKLIRVHSSNPLIQQWDKNINSHTLGLCAYNNNNTRFVYLAYDRLTDPIVFRCTTIHEYGHHINLQHTDGPSIMNQFINPKIMFPNKIDAIEYAKRFNCSPEDCKYIKI